MATAANNNSPAWAKDREPRSMESALNRPSPHSIDAEQAILACCLMDFEEALSRCDEARLVEESFYSPKHQIIFRAMQALRREGSAVDEILLTEKLTQMGELESIGGALYLTEIADRIETSAHLPFYIHRVRDTGLLRGLIRLSQETIESAFAEKEDVAHFINHVEQEVFKLSEARISDSAVNMERMMKSAQAQVKFLLEHRGEITGVPSGFTDLDHLTTGFHSPQMVVVAARPGMGKTSMALNIAEAAILPTGGKKEATPTLMFSLEMGADELALRLLCSRARVSAFKLKGDFTIPREMQQNLYEAGKQLEKAPLYVDDSPGLNILEMRAKARRMKARHGLGMVIIDYLQLVNSTDSRVPRHEQLGEVSRGVKAMAKELEIPVMALCQLNRATEQENRDPRMSDLRESGSIEQDADIVLLISEQREERRRGDDDDSGEEAEHNPMHVPRKLIIAKQRNGPTGSVPLVFNKSITRFENAARDWQGGAQ